MDETCKKVDVQKKNYNNKKQKKKIHVLDN